MSLFQNELTHCENEKYLKYQVSIPEGVVAVSLVDGMGEVMVMDGMDGVKAVLESKVGR